MLGYSRTGEKGAVSSEGRRSVILGALRNIVLMSRGVVLLFSR